MSPEHNESLVESRVLLPARLDAQLRHFAGELRIEKVELIRQYIVRGVTSDAHLGFFSDDTQIRARRLFGAGGGGGLSGQPT